MLATAIQAEAAITGIPSKFIQDSTRRYAMVIWNRLFVLVIIILVLTDAAGIIESKVIHGM